MITDTYPLALLVFAGWLMYTGHGSAAAVALVLSAVSYVIGAAYRFAVVGNSTDDKDKQ